MAKGFVPGVFAILLASSSLAFGQDRPGPRLTTSAALPTPAVVRNEDSTLNPPPNDCIAPYCLAADAPFAAGPYAHPQPGWQSDDDCVPVPSIWFTAEYLLWWVKNGPLGVPLVNTGDPADPVPGADGQPGTVMKFCNTLDFKAFSGGRFAGGFWCDGCQVLGLEGGGFFLSPRTEHFDIASASNGTPLIARPFFNSLTSQETAELVSSIGQFSGSVSVQTSSSMCGFDTNVASKIFRDCHSSVTLLSGFRYVQLDENIDIVQDTTLLAGGVTAFQGIPVLPPASIELSDHFRTFNQFYGGQIGTRAEYTYNRLYASVLGKVAVGATHQIGQIAGTSSLLVPGQPVQTVPGGLLALSSNSGRIARDEFSVVPEIGLNIGCRLTRHFTAYVGYSLLYWSDVARPGDLISRTINPALVPTNRLFGLPLGTAQPTSTLKSSDFWAQGANFGLEFSY